MYGHFVWLKIQLEFKKILKNKVLIFATILTFLALWALQTIFSYNFFYIATQGIQIALRPPAG